MILTKGGLKKTLLDPEWTQATLGHKYPDFIIGRFLNYALQPLIFWTMHVEKYETSQVSHFVAFYPQSNLHLKQFMFNTSWCTVFFFACEKKTR